MSGIHWALQYAEVRWEDQVDTCEEFRSKEGGAYVRSVGTVGFSVQGLRAGQRQHWLRRLSCSSWLSWDSRGIAKEEKQSSD